MAYNKVIYGNTTLIDLTADTVTASDVASGKTFHQKDGTIGTGSNTYDADTSDADAAASEILSTKTAYVNGVKLTGSMPNRGAISGIISSLSAYNVQSGYHDGSGTVDISSTEKAKIIAENIKSGVELLGVTGTYTGEAISAQSKSATPYTTSQIVLPDSGYDYLSQVSIAAIAYSETDNAAGGKTVTIGTVAP